MHNRKAPIRALLMGGIVLLAVLLLGVVVPIIINECYKANSGYLTVWSGADLLSYYGTLLGSVVAVFVLAATILFSRKQIHYERTLQQQQEKWRDVEQIVDQALDDMNPSKMQLIFANAAENSSPEQFVSRLFVYEATAQASVDKLVFSIGEEEYGELSELIGQIEAAMKKITEVKKEHLTWLQESYLCMSPLQSSPNGSGDQESKKMYEFLALREILSRWNDVQKSLLNVYEEEYRTLVASKKEVFSRIKKQVVANAEKKLYFLRM